MSFPISIKEVPFFRLIIPIIAGIICQYWLSILPFSWWNYIVILFFLGATLVCFLLSSRWRFRWLFGLVLNILLFFFGAILAIKQPYTDKIFENSSNRVILSLLDNPQLRAKSIRIEAEVVSVYNSIWWSVNEKMLVYFDVRDSLAAGLNYGAEIAVDIIPRAVSKSGNPNQFDYKKYLSDRDVRFTTYIQPKQWVEIGNRGVMVKRIALRLRDKLVLLFKDYGLSGDELAVASALTLGYQDLLDDELRKVYSSSGATHILSVSGLHVGILYMFLTLLLSFLDKSVATRAVKTLILLLFLWFFALITGLSPCVQRSALMFSFLVVGDFFHRKSNVYNTMAASAFVLLVINPHNLFDIGFQLSYLAVVSIIFFYPYISKLIYAKNWALNKIWSLVAVSIAAQFGTLPICILYFHQFPNYFLLANLIAIPLSTIALYLAVVLIIVSPIHFFAGYVGTAFSFSIRLLNQGLEYIEKAPYSVTEGLHISVMQMFILFGVILLVSLYLVMRNGRFVFASLLLLISFFALNLHYHIDSLHTNEFIVYNINKKSLVSFCSGRNLLFVDIDTNKVQFTDKYDFFTKGYISSVGAIKDIIVVNPLQEPINTNGRIIKIKEMHGVSLIDFNNKTIAIPFNTSLNRFIGSKRFEVDYLVINKYYPYNVFDLLKPKRVIIDSSVSKYALADIVMKCRLEGISYYCTSVEGAFVVDVDEM
ncbi:MAG: ComEC family competence protein [Bacteroidales bacterium]|nr:MAG: ComEC family competence protein [Bacteroidales bacterium]